MCQTNPEALNKLLLTINDVLHDVCFRNVCLGSFNDTQIMSSFVLIDLCGHENLVV